MLRAALSNQILQIFVFLGFWVSNLTVTYIFCLFNTGTVCFENKDEGSCTEGEVLNTTRWHFNHERNRCERFRYHGCSGNHNNFRTKEECNNVCPGKIIRLFFQVDNFRDTTDLTEHFWV